MSDDGRDARTEDGETVTFHRVDGHERDEERAAVEVEESVRLHTSGRVRDAEEEEDDDDDGGDDDEEAPEGGNERKTLCPAALCATASGDGRARQDAERPKRCPGCGLIYALMSTVLFATITLLVKKIEGLHAIEISAIRCFFQIFFVAPLLIYNKTGFLGPRDMRVFLMLRGFLGSSAMILLFYAVQQMPLADATVITFSNPVFTSILAWIILKEKCTIWDGIFTVFTFAGVVLIARPPFIFGSAVGDIETDYTKRMKGVAAAFTSAITAAFTLVILRKLGKSVHYYLSVWYYAVIGLLQSVIVVSALGEWKLPPCGRDRWLLILIAVLGVGAQSLLTKALQLENAGPVSLMRTGDVVLSFLFQYIFLNYVPTMWSIGGALCVVAATCGNVLRNYLVNRNNS
ncbi:unnamed protein product [Ophioblennius macclurei]